MNGEQQHRCQRNRDLKGHIEELGSHSRFKHNITFLKRDSTRRRGKGRMQLETPLLDFQTAPSNIDAAATRIVLCQQPFRTLLSELQRLERLVLLAPTMNGLR